MVGYEPSDTTSRVAFAKPPVTEVVFSVSLALSQPLHTAHVGAYWLRIRDRFPQVQELPPLDPIAMAQAADGQLQLRLHMDMRDLPPLRRTWFVTEDGRDLIQIQEDRFIFNWRRNAIDSGYPGFSQVNERFEEHFAEFLAFLTEEGLSAVAYPLLELVYVSQITAENGLSDVGFTAALADHRRDESRSRYLPKPLGINAQSLYPLPYGMGHLQVQAQANQNVVRLDISARGVPGHGEKGRRTWFETAHEAIVQGFVDVTAGELHERHWEREV